MITLRTVPTAASTDALGLLIECHARIRRFSRLAVRLATEPAPPKDVADAARAVHRYFAKALPLHVQDEDLSLTPLLLPHATPQERAAIERMNREHGPIDELIEELLPHWAALAEDPGRLDTEKDFLHARAEEMERFMLSHLENEESVIFPCARRVLDARQLDGLAAAMRQRRSPDAT